VAPGCHDAGDVGLQRGARRLVHRARARGDERVEHGVLVVSVDRLAHVIRVAAARGAHAPVKRLRGASRLRLDGPLPW
jgi:hypothetical protein